MVWMRHPTLPDATPVEIHADGVIHYYRAGWEECEAPPPPPPPAPMKSPTTEDDSTDGAPDESGASALPDTTPRAARQKKES